MDRLYLSAFTVTAGTLQAAPATAAVALEDAWLEAVRIVVPDGHNGLTGLQVRWGGTAVIPAGAGTFLVANDEVMDVPYRDVITTKGLALAGFNTDVFDHTFYLRWTVTDRPAAATAVISSPQAAGPATGPPGGVEDLTSGGPSAEDLAAADTLSVPDAELPDDSGGLAVNLVLPTVEGT